jgi:hypothetical protein
MPSLVWTHGLGQRQHGIYRVSKVLWLVLVELHLSKVYVRLYGVKQVANFCWLPIDCLILVIVRSDYILFSLARAFGPYFE